MKIVPYDRRYKNDFIEMNRAWISEMFRLEPMDEEELAHIDDAIAEGAEIFFALDEDGGVMACCMIAPRGGGEWEMLKFAAKGLYTGTGAGGACLSACIDYAREQRAEKIILVSNTKCVQAIHLYRKYGFTEVPVDKEKFPFERGNIAFEMRFTAE